MNEKLKTKPVQEAIKTNKRAYFEREHYGRNRAIRTFVRTSGRFREKKKEKRRDITSEGRKRWKPTINPDGGVRFGDTFKWGGRKEEKKKNKHARPRVPTQIVVSRLVNHVAILVKASGSRVQRQTGKAVLARAIPTRTQRVVDDGLRGYAMK